MMGCDGTFSVTAFLFLHRGSPSDGTAFFYPPRQGIFLCDRKVTFRVRYDKTALPRMETGVARHGDG